MPTPKQLLHATLHCEDPGLVGCIRRYAWSGDKSPRSNSGNALLATIGQKSVAHTPFGALEFYMWREAGAEYLLQFRGGPWQDYWVADFFDMWAVVKSNYWDLRPTILVVTENRGQVDIRYVEVPASFDPEERYSELERARRAEPPGRIPKNSAQAMRICGSCPVKTRCDATDRLHGHTTDWHANYPQP